jgi:hypothetical protein
MSSLETKDELVANVKEWIKIDGEIAAFKIEIKNRVIKKKMLTDRLVVVMKKNEIECFDINGGSIVYKKTNAKRAINGKMLLATLNEYYKETNTPEVAAEISQFILDSRETTTKETILRKMDKV